MITEKDLITYVFNRSALAASKIVEIENDENIQGEIEFFRNLKNNLDVEFSQEVKRKISEVIPDYSQENIYELYPIDISSDNNIKLAASSDYKLRKTKEASSFIDDAQSFLVRLNKTGENTRLFIFPIKEEIVKNITIVLMPSKAEYKLQSTEDFVEIPNIEVVSSIMLKVN